MKVCDVFSCKKAEVSCSKCNGVKYSCQPSCKDCKYYKKLVVALLLG